MFIFFKYQNLLRRFTYINLFYPDNNFFEVDFIILMLQPMNPNLSAVKVHVQGHQAPSGRVGLALQFLTSQTRTLF